MNEAPVTPSLREGQNAAATTPVVAAAKKRQTPSIADLTKLYEIGIISKQTLKQMVFAVCPVGNAVPVADHYPSGIFVRGSSLNTPRG